MYLTLRASLMCSMKDLWGRTRTKDLCCGVVVITGMILVWISGQVNKQAFSQQAVLLLLWGCRLLLQVIFHLQAPSISFQYEEAQELPSCPKSVEKCCWSAHLCLLLGTSLRVSLLSEVCLYPRTEHSIARVCILCWCIVGECIWYSLQIRVSGLPEDRSTFSEGPVLLLPLHQTRWGLSLDPSKHAGQ